MIENETKPGREKRNGRGSRWIWPGAMRVAVRE